MDMTTSIPSTTRPKTVCLLSSHGQGTVVMKNWEPARQLGFSLNCHRLELIHKSYRWYWGLRWP